MGFVILMLIVILVIFFARMLGGSSASASNSGGVRVRGRWGAYVRLAEKFQGTLVGGRGFRAPQLLFSYGGTQLILSTQRWCGRWGTRSTELTIEWPDAPVAWVIQPTRFADRVSRLLRRPEIQSGNRAFDREFQVVGSDPSRIIEVLTGGVQMGLRRLRDLPRDRSLLVWLSDGKLRIQKRGQLRDANVLYWFVTLGIELYDQIMLVERTEMQIVTDAPSGQPAPVCQVCGDGIHEQIVFCRRCQTPHHRDCWHYFGTCSVYACGETRYLSHRQAARLTSGPDD